MAQRSADWARNPNIPRLHALVIGINIYPFSNLPPLTSAISDADAFERYLIEYLKVPAQNIRNLRAEDATRSNILSALKYLQDDSNIRPGDPIVIYYSGHGGWDRAPDGWHSDGGVIQMILPSDYGPSVYGPSVYGIPDRTIGALLESLANAKGDNITVILDCCFSGSGTRSDNAEERIRGVPVTLPFPSGLDEEILASNSRGTAIPERFLHAGLRSHVLLAACGSQEKARETNGSGYFTQALLYTLKKLRVDMIKYTELIDHLPKLPTQNPQCEGYNRDRFLFNARVSNKSFFHKLNRTVEGSYEIGVGEAYGITQGALFVIYPSQQGAGRGPALQARPLRISPYKTLLDVPPDQTVTMSQDAVVLQVRVGVEDPFPIYISDRGLDGIVTMVQHRMKNQGMRELAVVNDARLAKLGLDLGLDNATKREVVALRILDLPISQWGLNKIHNTIPPSPDAFYAVLSAAARFDWHLHRESCAIGTSQVDIEFTKLRELSETIERQLIGGRLSNIKINRLVPDGPNMIATGAGLGGNVVFVDVLEEADYGIKLTNKTNVPLYVSVFYFDSSDLSIKSIHESSTSSSQSTAEAPLKPRQTLTIGYGSSGFSSFDYFLREGQDVDVGTLKFYFSTEAVNLMYVRQESPFGLRKGNILESHARRAVWGTVEVRVVQRRGPWIWR
ncbi:hypothetical protein BYT27DRAFT_7205049 [Phlegmacium glaucopus]|nr:hypothetical protein BYT27DRAFT_7205049 [Phlegmacium glaucopus]